MNRLNRLNEEFFINIKNRTKQKTATFYRSPSNLHFFLSCYYGSLCASLTPLTLSYNHHTCHSHAAPYSLFQATPPAVHTSYSGGGVRYLGFDVGTKK